MKGHGTNRDLDVVRVEVPRALMRDVMRAARLRRSAMGPYLIRRIREAIALDVVECDQRSASQVRYWDRRR